MPPPNQRPFAQMTLFATTRRSAPSRRIENSTLCQLANARAVAQRKAGVPPRRFAEAFARRATSPVSPQLPTLQKSRDAGAPSAPVKLAQPTSIVRSRPATMTSRACAGRFGIAYVRTKSQPVPRSITPRRGRSAAEPSTAASPFATSFRVPSPPTRRRAPGRPRRPPRDLLAWPGPSVSRASTSSPRARASRATCGQPRPVAPPSEAGLTTNTARATSAPQPFGSDSAARIASSVMRSTAARSSSSEMRTNSPTIRVRDGEQAAGREAAQRRRA